MMRMAQALRDKHAVALKGFLDHPFFAKVADGTLDTSARDAYFVYEHRFVEQAVVILGHILTKAPTTVARRHIVMMLNGLITEQTAVFDGIFETIGRRDRAMPQTVQNFCEGMTAIARDGSYEQGLAAMLAAEWTYAEVSERFATASISDRLMRDWFDLHTQQAFLAGVAWLEAELDTCGEMESDAACDQLSQAFLSAIALEVEFHNAPLESA